MPDTTEQPTPAPVLAIVKSRATISNLVFAWEAQCWSCQGRTELTSVGEIVVELHFSVSRKTCDWSFETRPGKAPLLPGECPACGKTGNWVTCEWRWLRDTPGYSSRHRRGATSVLPAWPPHQHYPFTLLEEAYTTLRATYPRESALADKAMQAEARGE